jgi:hypothetical protein
MPSFYNTKHKYYQMVKLRNRGIETILMDLRVTGTEYVG